MLQGIFRIDLKMFHVKLFGKIGPKIRSTGLKWGLRARCAIEAANGTIGNFARALQAAFAIANSQSACGFTQSAPAALSAVARLVTAASREPSGSRWNRSSINLRIDVVSWSA